MSTLRLQWQGYIIPRTYQTEIKSTPYVTSFTATDGIGDLKSLDFHTEQDWREGFKTSVRGKITQLDAFRICLSKLKLSQGFRVALNVFDTTHTTANNTPINQTNIKSDIYTEYDVKTRIENGALISIEEPSYTSCEDVLKDILTVYKAVMISWEGYWYIIDQEEFLNATINYVEYDSVGTYVGTGSLTPQVSFSTAQSTSRWRWMGTQTATTTDVYRNIIFNLNFKLREGGILGFPSLKIGNTINVITGIISPDTTGGRQRIGGLPIDASKYQNVTEETALNYLLFNDSIIYSGADSITLKIISITNLTYGRRSTAEIPEAIAPPYLNMRWMLKVNYKYSSPYKKVGNLRTGISDINWSTNETINDHYVTDWGGEDSLEIKVPFDQVEKTTSTYALRVYIPNLYDYDVEGSNEANMILAMKAESTSTLKGGHRKIARYLSGAIHFYFYYETQLIAGSQDDLNIIIPTTGSPLNWRLVHSREYPTLDGDSMTETIFNEISLTQNPEGFDAPEEVQISSLLKSGNKIDLEKDLNVFDEYSIINNASKIYDNHTEFTDGTPTSAWTKTGGTVSKTLQQHLLDWNTQLLKQPRQIVNGSFISDVQITPLSTLKDLGSSNRIYWIGGLSLNDYRQEYNGEIIEIGSDDTPNVSAFTTGFKQNAVT